MSADLKYQQELDYLVRYAEMTPVYFYPLRDGAEKVAGAGSSEAEIQEMTLRLIGDLLDRGVRFGDMSPREGEGVIPWDLTKDQVLDKVRREMQAFDDPLEFIDICWFSSR